MIKGVDIPLWNDSMSQNRLMTLYCFKRIDVHKPNKNADI